MDRVYRDQVIGWIARHLSVDASHLTRETTLLDDLGVNGDDAAELMEGFARHFGVDLGNFRFDRHFDEEGYDPTQALHSLIGNRRTPGLVSLTIGDLVEAAKRHAWPSVEPGADSW